MMRYEAVAPGVQVSAVVSDGDRSVGEVVNVQGQALLAVTPVESHTRMLAVADVAISPLGLPYAL